MPCFVLCLYPPFLYGMHFIEGCPFVRQLWKNHKQISRGIFVVFDIGLVTRFFKLVYTPLHMFSSWLPHFKMVFYVMYRWLFAAVSLLESIMSIIKHCSFIVVLSSPPQFYLDNMIHLEMTSGWLLSWWQLQML